MTRPTTSPIQRSSLSWSITPCSSKNAVYDRSSVVRPRPSSVLPPAAERTYVRPSAYPGGLEGEDGVVREVMVIRSVTICEHARNMGCVSEDEGSLEVKDTHAFVERLALADEHDVAFNEVGI